LGMRWPASNSRRRVICMMNSIKYMGVIVVSLPVCAAARLSIRIIS
jgi:hypothetical protein